MRTISKSTGRSWLIAMVTLGFVAGLSSVAIITNNKGMTVGNAGKCLALLLEIHLPLLSLILAYFRDSGVQVSRKQEKTSTLAMSFTIAMVTLAAVVIPLALLWSSRVEEMMLLMDVLKPFGGAFVLGLLGWYFAVQQK